MKYNARISRLYNIAPILAMRTVKKSQLSYALLAAGLLISGGSVQPANASSANHETVGYQTATASQPGYVQMVSQSEQSQIIAHVQISKAVALKAERAPDLPANMVRYYVEADIVSLLRGERGLPKTIRFLMDMPRDNRGKAQKIKKKPFLIFARYSNQPGEVQLINSDGWLAWNQNDDQQLRAINRQLLAADAPPVITGIAEALHVRGNLVGEGQSQIFLTTHSGAPVSLSVFHRPETPPRWSVSLSEIVDVSARPPERDSLLWYRLACFLPQQIPANKLVSASPQDDQVVARDYQFIRRQLGPCSDQQMTLSNGAQPGAQPQRPPIANNQPAEQTAVQTPNQNSQDVTIRPY